MYRKDTKRESFKELNDAQATLLISFGSTFKSLLTSKSYDYLALNKPIICYPRDYDVVDDILQRTNLGMLCNTNKQLIEQLIL